MNIGSWSELSSTSEDNCIEVANDLDRDGELRISITEMHEAFSGGREHVVYLTKAGVKGLFDHLSKILERNA